MATMREVEVKVLEIDPEEMARRIERLGGVRIFEGLLDAITFRPRPPHGGLLRLRKEGEDIFLTVKSASASEGFARANDETSIKVDDFDGTVRLLGTLGFFPHHRRTKQRVSYSLGEARIELEQFSGELADIPPFLEIEAASEAILKETLTKLSIPHDRAVDLTNSDVVERYRPDKS
jgi:adenylate cyclase class 2